MTMLLGLALFSACASRRTWPDYEKSAENKMIMLQENIGDGLKTGSFTPDTAQMFLTALKGVSTEFAELKGKKVSLQKWDSIHKRLDLLGDDLNRVSVRAARIEEPKNGNRIVATQKSIDDGRISGRVPLSEEKEFQIRLGSIRKEYLQMTAAGRSPTHQERADISKQLDALIHDINSFR
jgi:hypothetical protein